MDTYDVPPGTIRLEDGSYLQSPARISFDSINIVEIEPGTVKINGVVIKINAEEIQANSVLSRLFNLTVKEETRLLAETQRIRQTKLKVEEAIRALDRIHDRATANYVSDNADITRLELIQEASAHLEKARAILQEVIK